MEARETLAAELKRAFAALELPRRETAMPPTAREAIVRDDDATASISFTMPLLRAVLAGQKIQTRRPIRPVPQRVIDGAPFNSDGAPIAPLCNAGERLWLREKWARVGNGFVYAADSCAPRVRWISSRFMPRTAARSFLRVNKLAVARLNDIDDADALREGAAADPSATMFGPRAWFIAAWDAIYGDAEFASANDPWVWIYDFTLEGVAQG